MEQAENLRMVCFTFNFNLADQSPLKTQKMLTGNWTNTLRLLQIQKKIKIKHWTGHEIKAFIKAYEFLFMGSMTFRAQ